MTPVADPIGIDVRYLSHGLVGGVHTYVRSLVEALFRQSDDRQLVLYADGKSSLDIQPTPRHVLTRTLPWRNALSSVAGDLWIGAMMREDGIGIAHFPANYGLTPHDVPLVVTLHDAINLLPLRQILRDDSKQARHVLIMAYLHVMTRYAMRRRPVVVTVSHYSRREILRRTALPEEQVQVVYSAHAPDCRPLDGADSVPLRAELGARSRILLADAIKNPDCALRAYRSLPAEVRDDTTLVFFARRPPSDNVQAAAARGECRLLIRPSRETLVRLYNLADLFIFPSWYEGFGLPVLESMACGTPVVASSRGALPEITGDGGIIVDAEDHRAIAAAVVRLFNDPDEYAALRVRALAWSSRFSWDQTAREMLRIYDDAYLAWRARLGWDDAPARIAHRAPTPPPRSQPGHLPSRDITVDD